MSSSTTIPNPEYHTAAMSYAEWKRETSTMDVLFRLQLPYRPPKSFIGHFLWRRRLWVEVTFALSMLEPWEKALVLVVMYLWFGLLAMGAVLYLPHHLAFLSARASYYLFGRDIPSEGSGAGVDITESLGRLKDIASWGFNTSLSSIANIASSAGSLAGQGADAATEL